MHSVKLLTNIYLLGYFAVIDCFCQTHQICSPFYLWQCAGYWKVCCDINRLRRVILSCNLELRLIPENHMLLWLFGKVYCKIFDNIKVERISSTFIFYIFQVLSSLQYHITNMHFSRPCLYLGESMFLWLLYARSHGHFEQKVYIDGLRLKRSRSKVLCYQHEPSLLIWNQMEIVTTMYCLYASIWAGILFFLFSFWGSVFDPLAAQPSSLDHSNS